jgi:hypothetical protein
MADRTENMTKRDQLLTFMVIWNVLLRVHDDSKSNQLARRVGDLMTCCFGLRKQSHALVSVSDATPSSTSSATFLYTLSTKEKS